MRRSVIVRIPGEYRPKVVQEEIDLALPSTLDVMGHILKDYFDRKPLVVTRPDAVVPTQVTAPVTTAVTAVTTPVTEGSTVTPPGSTPDTPKTLYGGRIYVIP